MMAKHNELGQIGESLASDFLVKAGFIILETNWRFSRAEIDIIAKDRDVLVFVEVKTRSSTNFGKPESFVTFKKEKLLVDAASAYMEMIQYEWEIRFDVIGILLKKDKTPQISYYKDAFFPRLA